MRVSNKIRKVFTPLEVNAAYTVTGSALAQVYKAQRNEYEPNRLLTPTVIKPVVNITDKDGVFESGIANRKLGNMKWWINGIDISTTEDFMNGIYVIDSSDTTERGSLTIYKNVAAVAPIKLAFTAIIADSRTGHNIKIAIENILLITQDVSADKYTLEIDKPIDSTYNPINLSSYSYVVNPVVFLGENKLVNLAGLTFKMFFMNGTNVVECTASNSPELTLNAGVSTFDLRLISNRTYLLKLLKNNTEMSFVQYSIQRKYPNYTLMIRDYGDVRKNQAIIPGTAIIHAEKTIVANPGLYFSIKWKTYSLATGEVEHNQGENALIPADITGVNLGPVDIYCEVDEKPAMTVATDSTGEIYTDSNDEPYIFN